ncbi:hypothetical protein [Flavobacterium soyae]|uniref:hypothetical protein n=1 Tax=Flavobacterium soyae TaxID=2903098 RepID=UPI001E4DF66D|nr:hypothetical protein [Flavobacterium soyae]MCD9575452.1 hypothetical protein [Flavobacterium soyae]
MSALKPYKVQLTNRPGFGKQIFTINTWLSAYINDHYYVEEAERLLIGNINKVLSGEAYKGGGQTQSLYFAEIYRNETKIYQDLEAWEQNNNITPDFVLPTTDFKVIVEAWRDFLKK